MNNLPFLRFIKNGDFDKAKGIIPFFYYILLYVAVSQLLNINSMIQGGYSNFSPRWPIFWAEYISYPTAVKIIIIFFVLTALFACFFHEQRWQRTLALLGVLQFTALNYSFGFTHQWDLWVWIAFFFVVLPNVWGTEDLSPETREKFLTVFWGAQAFTLLIYSMSGMWKVLAAIQQFFNGEVSIFSPSAPALHIATQFIKESGSGVSVFGPFIIDHPIVAWFPLLAAVYLQFFSLWAAFKPNLHRLWAFGLVAFHIGVYLTLYVIQFNHIAIILLLLANSPFRDINARWSDIFYDLPVIGPLVRISISKIQKWRGRIVKQEPSPHALSARQ